MQIEGRYRYLHVNRLEISNTDSYIIKVCGLMSNIRFKNKIAYNCDVTLFELSLKTIY